MYQKAKNEVQVFKEFAAVVPYSIDMCSITKKEPPEPDISCALLDGTQIAFELVECIDESMAQAIYDAIRLKKALGEQLGKLPRREKEEFKRKYGNAMINIAFAEEASLSKKLRSLPTIHNYLLTLKGNPVGKLDLRDHQELKGVVRRILINRGTYVGPIFNLTPFTYFDEPAKERIESKFKKNYETKSSVELLAYYQLQPEIPENAWLPSVQEFVESNISESQFQRVWIYSCTQNRVIYVYPSP